MWLLSNIGGGMGRGGEELGFGLLHVLCWRVGVCGVVMFWRWGVGVLRCWGVWSVGVLGSWGFGVLRCLGCWEEIGRAHV